KATFPVHIVVVSMGPRSGRALSGCTPKHALRNIRNTTFHRDETCRSYAPTSSAIDCAQHAGSRVASLIPPGHSERAYGENCDQKVGLDGVGGGLLVCGGWSAIGSCPCAACASASAAHARARARSPAVRGSADTAAGHGARADDAGTSAGRRADAA